MESRLKALELRRLALISRCDGQREELLQNYRDVQRSLGIVKGAIGVIRALRAHPALIMGLAALILTNLQRKSADRSERGTGSRILRLLRAFQWGRRALSRTAARLAR